MWPLDDEPFLWFEAGPDRKPEWDKDPPTFSLLWRQNSDVPIQIPGPHIVTNLFGRTAVGYSIVSFDFVKLIMHIQAEVFADFPTDFSDSPSPPSSPALSPVSPAFSPASIGEEDNGEQLTVEVSDPSIDEVTQQLSERVHFDSPPQSPRPASTSEPPYIPDVDAAPPPSSPFMCNPLSVNSLSDTFSSSSSTLSVGTSSTAPSTYAVSPSPKPFGTSSSSSPAPELCRSPRRSPPATVYEQFGDEYMGSPAAGHSIEDLDLPAPPLNQIVLEEYPADIDRRRAKRSGSYPEVAEDFDLAMDDIDPRPRKKATKTARKRHPCTIPGCIESFTRPNDVLRHIKNAAIHKGTVQQAEALAAANSTLCKYCGEGTVSS